MRRLVLAALVLLPVAPRAGPSEGRLKLVPVPAEPPAASSEPPAVLRPTAETPPPLTLPAGDLDVMPLGAGLAKWLDLPHAFLERRAFDVVNGFDNFFADQRAVECLSASSRVRVRNVARIGFDGAFSYDVDVRAHVSLPDLRSRFKGLRVIFERFGRDTGDPEAGSLSGEPRPRGGDALLGWAPIETVRTSFDLGGGLLFDLPLGLTGRARFRHARPLGVFGLGRVATTGFWNSRDGFGFTASTSLERPLGTAFLARAAGGTMRSQISAGFESAAELSLLARLGRLTALTLMAGVTSHTVPELEVTAYRAALRFRTSLLRTWIFAELEPEIRWPLDAAGTHRPVRAVILRLEFRFEDHPPPSLAGADAAGCR